MFLFWQQEWLGYGHQTESIIVYLGCRERKMQTAEIEESVLQGLVSFIVFRRKWENHAYITCCPCDSNIAHCNMLEKSWHSQRYFTWTKKKNITFLYFQLLGDLGIFFFIAVVYINCMDFNTDFWKCIHWIHLDVGKYVETKLRYL